MDAIVQAAGQDFDNPSMRIRNIQQALKAMIIPLYKDACCPPSLIFVLPQGASAVTPLRKLPRLDLDGRVWQSSNP